jgi:two-component system NtrC family sensor kinase
MGRNVNHFNLCSRSIMKKIFTLLIIYSTFTSFKGAFCQQRIVDSLRSELNREVNAEKKLGLYEEIIDEVMELNLDTSIPYIDTLERMADKAGSINGKAKVLNLRGKIQKAKGDMEGAIVFYRQDLALRIQLNDPKGISQSFNNIGAAFAELYLPDSAIANYLKSVEINEKTGDYSSLASGYSNIGNLYSDQKLHDKAIDYLEKALKIRLEHGEEKKCMYTYNNLATAYGTSGNIDKAMEYANKGIAIALKYGNKFVAGVIEGGLGHLLIEKGKNEEAITHCERSVQLLEEANRKTNLVFPLVNLATAYNALNKPEQALKFALKGYAIMQETKQVDPLEVYYEEIAKAYEKKGNSKEALLWFRKFMALDDSLFKAENIKNLANVETKYQTQKKETQIAQQNLTLSKQRNELFRQKTWLIAMIAGFALFLFIALLLWRINKERKRANALLVQQKDEIQKTLSELKSTQAQLIQSEKMASLGELTAGIAHEIQNPLNFVNNFSEINKELLVEMKDEIDKGNLTEVKTIANGVIENEEKINHHGKRADAIVKGMLQHSQSSTGLKEPTDINKLADEYLRLSYHGLRAKEKTFNATLKTDFDESIGNINIIPQDIGRVVLNLINNAFYAAPLLPEGGVSDPDYVHSPTVWVRTKKVGDKVLISVRDNGPGIPQKILDKIFQPFFTTKPTGQGTGLGLSLSYEIVKAHGGELKVETKEGEGSTFIIELPA